MTLRKNLLPGALATIALALVAALSLNVTNAAADPAPTVAEPEVVPGETILTFEDPAVADRVLASAESSDALEAEVLADDLAGQTVITVTSDTPAKAQALIGAAEALPGVTAQPNYVYTLIDGETEAVDEALADPDLQEEFTASVQALPTNFPLDKLMALQYALLDIGDGQSQSGSNVFEAWDLVLGQPTHDKVTVAVIDSGIYSEHEDLQENINYDLAYSVFEDDPSCEDVIGHGTGVTGVIAATTGNGLGVAGVASVTDDLVSVVPVRVFEDTGETYSSSIVEAIDYVDGLIEDGKVDNLRVVNMSLGIPSDDGVPTDSALMQSIYHLTDEHGVLVVGAGGNGDENQHAVTTTMYPGDDEHCLCVTALTETGANATFSDYNEAKDISAPGVGVAFPSIDSPHVYEKASGTSYSAPIASGVAALMYAVDPTLTPEEVIEIIKTTAAPLPDTSINNWGDKTGSAGALDAGAALRETLKRAGAELPVDPTDGIEVYRLYNSYTTEHLFTTDQAEYDALGASGWNREGLAWVSPEDGVPVYRLYNPYTHDHVFTTDKAEYDALCAGGWSGEDVKMYGTDGDGLAVWRLYNPSLAETDGAFSHLWTADENEYNQLATDGWLQEGQAWTALG